MGGFTLFEEWEVKGEVGRRRRGNWGCYVICIKNFDVERIEVCIHQGKGMHVCMFALYN